VNANKAVLSNKSVEIHELGHPRMSINESKNINISRVWDILKTKESSKCKRIVKERKKDDQIS